MTEGAGGAAFGGTATAGGAALATGVAGVAGATGAFGGITTTAGGLCAATDAGVTRRGRGGSTTGLRVIGLAGAAGASAFASIVGTVGAAGGFATGLAGGCSAASFCCVMARRTSPGREICDRSILVLNSSSPAAARDGLAAVAGASEWARRCLRTSSASCSSSELECVFFSVTPYPGKRSMMAFALTSSSRANSLIRTWFASVMRPISPSYAGTFVA